MRRAGFMGGLAGVSPDDFVFTIDTTKLGVTGSNGFRFPLNSLSSYQFANCIVFWGDGTSNSLIYTGNSAPIFEHIYSIAGVYTVVVKGRLELTWCFNNTGDRLKILSVQQWGSNLLPGGNTNDKFMRGCANLDLSSV